MDEKKILVVDDDPQIITLLTDFLEDEGYSIDSSPDAEDALKKVENGHYDLVISDVRMPGMDGFELLKEIKASFGKMKVIMMTGYTDDYDISDVLLLGADDYITKPFDIDRVLLSVKNLLNN
jgi:DNA-binding response OmpR family regulator